MATLKRNDPCLCGSGKKYKKCCLITLQAKPKFDQEDQRAFNELLPKLFDYSKEFDGEIQPVYEKYVQSFERLPKPDAQAFSQLLFHWMLFNYPIDSDNQTILDDYVTNQSRFSAIFDDAASYNYYCRLDLSGDSPGSNDDDGGKCRISIDDEAINYLLKGRFSSDAKKKVLQRSPGISFYNDSAFNILAFNISKF